MQFDEPSAYGRDSRNTDLYEVRNELNHGNRSPAKLSVTERSLHSSGTLHLSPSKTKMRENSKNNVTKINSKTQTGIQSAKKAEKINLNQINDKKKQVNDNWKIIASSI